MFNLFKKLFGGRNEEKELTEMDLTLSPTDDPAIRKCGNARVMPSPREMAFSREIDAARMQ